MLTFEEMVAGYEAMGDKEALLDLRAVWEEVARPAIDSSPMVKIALAKIRSERLALIEEALRRMEQ